MFSHTTLPQRLFTDEVRPQSDALDLVEGIVWTALKYLTRYGPVTLEALVQRSRFPRASVTFALGDLVAKGLVTVDDEQKYTVAVLNERTI